VAYFNLFSYATAPEFILKLKSGIQDLLCEEVDDLYKLIGNVHRRNVK